MEVRPADTDDSAAIKDVAERSMRASYSLSPRQIETLIEEEFGADALDARDGESLTLVAEDDGELVAVALGSQEGDAGEVKWLQVAPEYRGQGAGTELVERAREELEDRGAGTFRMRVLRQNSEGQEFAERFDLHRGDRQQVSVAGEDLVEFVYTSEADADDETNEPNEPSVDVPDTLTEDGDELSVAGDEEVPGEESPFYAVYRDGDRYGFFCSNCGSVDTYADDLDRVKCTNCGNLHRPEEWDGAYL